MNIKMKNYKLLAVAFSLLFVGQIGAVEKGTDPQDEMNHCNLRKSCLKTLEDAVTNVGLTWTPQSAAWAVCDRGEDGKNGVERGIYANLCELAKENSIDGQFAKSIKSEFNKRFDLIFLQGECENKLVKALNAVQVATEKFTSNKTDENKLLLEKAGEALELRKAILIKFLANMAVKVAELQSQIKKDSSTQAQGWKDPDSDLRAYDVKIYECEMRRLVSAEFVPNVACVQQVSPQDEGYDIIDKFKAFLSTVNPAVFMKSLDKLNR